MSEKYQCQVQTLHQNAKIKLQIHEIKAKVISFSLLVVSTALRLLSDEVFALNKKYCRNIGLEILIKSGQSPSYIIPFGA